MSLPSSPSTELYTLGKGILSIGEWSGDTPPASVTDVGNCSEMTVEVTEETLAHYSSRSGTRKKDKEVSIEVGYTLSFVLDEISVANLAKYLRGEVDAVNSSKIHAAQNLDTEFALEFQQDNPVGPNQFWEFWKVKLKPNGAFNLISDEWSTLAFTGEGLADETNHASSPYFDVTLKDAGTTTTTA